MGPGEGSESVEASLEEVADVPAGRQNPFAAQGSSSQPSARRSSQSLHRSGSSVYRGGHLERKKNIFKCLEFSFKFLIKITA